VATDLTEISPVPASASHARAEPGTLLRWIVLSGAAAGALDISFAFIFYGRQGASAGLILRGIASGLFGVSAFRSSDWFVAIGALLHFALSVTAAGAYALATHRTPALQPRPLLAGTLFGVLWYVVMHAVVLPLSRYSGGPASIGNVIGELCSHIFLFGMVIAFGVGYGRSLQRRT
jgi:hypothetical protein